MSSNPNTNENKLFYYNTRYTIGLKTTTRLQTIAKIVGCISQVRETGIHQSFGNIWIT